MHAQVSSIANEISKYKVVFLGQSGAGKTSLVQQMVHGTFNNLYQPTIYLDSLKKNIIYQGRILRFVFWDTAGQERFNSLVPSAIRGSHFALIVFDICDRESFQKCSNWIKILKQTNNPNRFAILIGNKNDLKRVIDKNEAYDFAVSQGMRYIQTSAKDRTGIDNLITQIIQNIQSKNQSSTKSSENQISTKNNLVIKNKVKLDQMIQLKKSNIGCCSI